MAHSIAFAAVDWGTSSFRLWLVTPAGAIAGERRSAEGMSTLQPHQFEPLLRGHLAALGIATAVRAEPLSVLICGMAGARQGWAEAGYVDVPASALAIVEGARSVAAAGLDVRILPGLAQRLPDRPDVLRGEETQLLGLLLAGPALSATVVMPGTHSKWVDVSQGRITGFHSAMTGELFALLSRQSILRHSIGEHAAATDPASTAFLAGVQTAAERRGAILDALFSLRADSRLNATGAAATADRLSGLLIGAELVAGLAMASPGAIKLVSGGRIGELYVAAFAALGRSVSVIDADSVVIGGLRHAAAMVWPDLQEKHR